MNFKLTLIALVIGLSFISCGETNSSSDSLVKKRITQMIESQGMGLLKDLKIESIEKVSDSTYIGVHSFTNPIFAKEVRVTRIYTFTADLDSITAREDLKTEMKSEGEWVATGF